MSDITIHQVLSYLLIFFRHPGQYQIHERRRRHQATLERHVWPPTATLPVLVLEQDFKPAGPFLLDPSPVVLLLDPSPPVVPTPTINVYQEPTRSIPPLGYIDQGGLGGSSLVSLVVIACLVALFVSAVRSMGLAPRRFNQDNRLRTLHPRLAKKTVEHARPGSYKPPGTSSRKQRFASSLPTTRSQLLMVFNSVRNATSICIRDNGLQALVISISVLDTILQLTTQLSDSPVLIGTSVIVKDVLFPVLGFLGLIVLRAAVVLLQTFGAYVWRQIGEPREITSLSTTVRIGESSKPSGSKTLSHDDTVESAASASDEPDSEDWPDWFKEWKVPGNIQTPTQVHHLREIGKGACGTVSIAWDEKSYKCIAVKRVTVADFEDELEMIAMEIGVWLEISGSHMFPTLHGMWLEESSTVALPMSFYRNGNLLSLCNRFGGALPPKLVTFYTAELILAVHHLHQHNIIHHDLKPDNLLIDNRGHLIVADFGRSHLFGLQGDPDPQEYPSWAELKSRGGDDFPLLWAGPDNPHVIALGGGTVDYWSPEVDAVHAGGTEVYSYGIDYWSVGVIAYEMTTGYLPYACTGTTLDDLELVRPLVLDLKRRRHHYQMMDNSGLRLVKMLFATDPLDRPSVSQMKSHPYFREIDWEKLAKRRIPPPFDRQQ